MAEKYDPKFASYATRVAFNLSLTRPQIFYLTTIADQTIHERSTVYEDPQRTNHFVPCANVLLNRGLVTHYPNGKPGPNGEIWWELTEAGKHVMALLRIAGLAAVKRAPANEEAPKPRHRVKAGSAP